MKKTLLILALAAGALTTSQASVIYQNLTQAVGQTAGNFTFNKFNQQLGTLTGVTFTIVSSTDSGSFSFKNLDAGSATVSSAKDALTIVDNQNATGNYDGGLKTLTASPTIPYDVASGNTQTFVLTSKSLAANVATDLTADLAYYESLTGAGVVSFAANLNKVVNNNASIATLDTGLWVNSTHLQLAYDYTAAPVPEPSQVAASVLLIGGITGFVVVRRRKSAATVA